jgi:hypothetical protein
MLQKLETNERGTEIFWWGRKKNSLEPYPCPSFFPFSLFPKPYSRSRRSIESWRKEKAG